MSAVPARVPHTAVDEASDRPAPARTETVDVRQQVAGLKKKLEEAADEFGRLQSGLATQQQLENLLKQGRLHLQDLRSRLQETIAERDQLQAEYGDFKIAHQREVERLQLQIQDATAQALLQRTMSEQREEEQREQADNLRQQLQRMTIERDRALADVEDRDAAHKRFTEERDEERSTFERLLAEATSNQREMVQELDEQRQQIQTLREAAMRAQSLARQIMRAHESIVPDPEPEA